MKKILQLLTILCAIGVFAGPAFGAEGAELPEWATKKIMYSPSPEEFITNFFQAVEDSPRQVRPMLMDILYATHYITHREIGVENPFDNSDKADPVTTTVLLYYSVAKEQGDFCLADAAAMYDGIKEEHPAYFQEYHDVYRPIVMREMHKLYGDPEQSEGPDAPEGEMLERIQMLEQRARDLMS